MEGPPKGRLVPVERARFRKPPAKRSAVELHRIEGLAPHLIVGLDPEDAGNPPTIESAAVVALKGEFTTGALAQMQVELAEASAKVQGAAEATGPSLSGDLAWEAEVKWT